MALNRSRAVICQLSSALVCAGADATNVNRLTNIETVHRQVEVVFIVVSRSTVLQALGRSHQLDRGGIVVRDSS